MDTYYIVTKTFRADGTETVERHTEEHKGRPFYSEIDGEVMTVCFDNQADADWYAKI